MNQEILQASHALLIAKDGEILLQHKDDDAKILNPGRVSMFGGAMEGVESEIEGLRRELSEELELNLDEFEFYKLNDYLKTKEHDTVDHLIHIYVVKNVEIEKLNLHEGQAILSEMPEKHLLNPKLSRITKLALEDFIKAV